jgi:hypothetical protein
MSQQVRVAAAQAEPRWLDIAAGVEQVVDLIAEAARGGAQLVAFPETFLPGYPWWIWLDSPAWGMRFVARYSENSMTRDGAEMDRIAAAAADQGIHVALGFSERDGGSLYMAQAFIDECDAGKDVHGNPFSLVRLDPVTLIVAMAVVSLSRLIGLVIALRGAAPCQRPAIIRALAELFRVMPPRRRGRPNYQQRSRATSTSQLE